MDCFPKITNMKTQNKNSTKIVVYPPAGYNCVELPDLCNQMSKLFPLVKPVTQLAQPKVITFMNGLPYEELKLLEFTYNFFTPKFDILNTNKYVKWTKTFEKH